MVREPHFLVSVLIRLMSTGHISPQLCSLFIKKRYTSMPKLRKMTHAFSPLIIYSITLDLFLVNNK